jgi:predicted transposase/invertase (TIGR01784 family)
MKIGVGLLGAYHPIIRKAYDVLEAHHWTIEDLRRYERMEKINMDMRAREAFVIDAAEARGEARGQAKGEAHAKKQMAKRLKEAGFDDKTIAELTD